ncbi:MAG: YraN family protein [Acidobacteriia bacterium]|nr:YraN family protein [Terriglobia bacterium]
MWPKMVIEAWERWVGHPRRRGSAWREDPLALGREGERQAYRFLRRQGYQVVARNFRSPRGEVDLIAWDRDILCFVEVKTRIDVKHGRPEEAVTPFKQRQILNASLDYLRQAGLHRVNTRYEIAAVEFDQAGAPVCRLIQQAGLIR